MAQQLLPLGLAFIMFAVGIGLRFENFKEVALHPQAFFVGLANQVLVLPLIGLLVVSFYNGPVEFALGIMILAACPGGITSNLIAVLASGNAALSVSMTAVTSLASIFTVPAVLYGAHLFLMGDGHAIQMPVGRVMAGIFLITGVPVLLGMFLNLKLPSLCKSVMPYVRSTATLIFALIVAGAFISNMDNITTHFFDVGLFLVLLNIATIGLGFLIARKLNCNRADSITICLECGLQNVALAIFIAINILNDANLMIPAIIYALVMNVSAAVIIFLVRATTPKALPHPSK
ncbi:bile acid:sodium symporter family protein [Terasakiella sp. A23]|uniref:bile acid:sodium symporter family protein n=1 Tax=Terasakiella sp. FCG-A23 TaxID=3080561 RepID=UPI002954CF07|nr:bile acid:sodium symporter family protein [Terasakiella sp. A23]MDV7341070.1 bile acid:sodium symporter family protein [Terasakiella sp. A23]